MEGGTYGTFEYLPGQLNPWAIDVSTSRYLKVVYVDFTLVFYSLDASIAQSSRRIGAGVSHFSFFFFHASIELITNHYYTTTEVLEF